jgi:hypothetical protein
MYYSHKTGVALKFILIHYAIIQIIVRINKNKNMVKYSPHGVVIKQGAPRDGAS